MIRCARFAVCFILLAALSARAQLPTLEPLVSGLSQPVFLTHAHDGSNRKFIVEQAGRILVMQPGSSATSLYLDIRTLVVSGGEQGLLGLTFHPQYATNGRFFVNYTRQPDGATVVAEYRVSTANPNLADPSSAVVLLVIPQPFVNHNGGMIEFGPDNYLYIGMGDGGSSNDPNNFAQDVNQLLGKFLRIDVDHPSSPTVRYSAPSTNPFFGSVAGRDEIFATGIRNPWRFSFDRVNGRLYAGDVGQGAREEIDIVIRGGNYGWRVLEGTVCTGLGPASCDLNAVRPIVEYFNGQAGRCAVTGGYVYRGTRQSLPFGAYVFGDYCSGEIYMIDDGVTSLLLDTNLNISSFGEDESGEIYVVHIGGSVSRIAGPPSPGVTQRRYLIPNRGGVFLPANGVENSLLSTGYARITADSNDAPPNGLEILSLRKNGVRISEMTIPATPLVQSGRIFALVSGSITTGLAIANPNAFSVNVDFHFTNPAGQDFGHGTTTIPDHGQIAALLNQSPFNGGSAINGTLTFRASGLVAATAIRSVSNDRSESLLSTLPVVPINATVLNGTLFPFWVDGQGWRSEFVLVNPSDVLVSGVINLVGTAGQTLDTLTYSILPRSSTRVFPATSPTLRSGYARMTATGGPLPSGVGVVSWSTGAGLVTETAIPAIAPGFEFRGYAEFSSVASTGLALSNLFGGDATVTVELRNLDGTLRDREDIDLPPSGHRALFLDEISGITSDPPFLGIIRVSSDTPIAVTTVRVRVNERGDYVINGVAPVNVADPVVASELFFPHLAVGGGFDMQYVLINPQNGADSGTMRFFAPDGNALPLRIP